MKEIYCEAVTPPMMEDDGEDLMGDNEDYLGITLYVPEASVNNYKATHPWSKFSTITSGITTPKTTSATTTAVYYDLSGKRLKYQPEGGVYIRVKGTHREKIAVQKQ